MVNKWRDGGVQVCEATCRSTEDFNPLRPSKSMVNLEIYKDRYTVQNKHIVEIMNGNSFFTL